MAEALPDPLSASPETRWTRSRIAGAGFFLICVTALAYLPALRGGFVWDDDTFLTQNPLIKAGDGLYRMWFTTQPSDYWPVSYSTLWVEWRLWGMNALGYHLTNLALHLGEALLLWGILRRLRVPGAYLAALLFAVHPVNVESVAWIAQRKNLMGMLFFLASTWCFLKTGLASPTPVRRSSASRSEGGGGWYWLSLLAFILAMLSKGSVAMLPVVLLGLIAWQRRLTRKDLALVLPFFAVAAVLVLTDIWFQKHGASEALRAIGFWERLLGAGTVVWFYLGKALVPLNLIFVYPSWHIRVADPLWWLPLLGAAALTVWLWRSRQPLARSALFAWTYFCVMLFPVMGFTDVYFMKYSLVADHYQHLAIIGVIGFVAAQWQRIPRHAAFAAAALVLLLAGLTWRQCGMYRDAETLYRVTLEKNPDCWMAYNNLGNVLLRSRRAPEAVPNYEEALRLKSDLPVAEYNLGLALTQIGRVPDSIPHFERAIRLKPNDADAHGNLGVALAAVGRSREAISEYREVLRLRPDDPDALYNLGNALRRVGQQSEAIDCYQETLRLRPRYVPAAYNLSLALANTGRLSEAIAELERILQIEPDYAEAHDLLGQILCAIGRNQEGAVQLQLAAKLRTGRNPTQLP